MRPATARAAPAPCAQAAASRRGQLVADLEDLRAVDEQEMGAVGGVEQIEVPAGDRQGLRLGRRIDALRMRRSSHGPTTGDSEEGNADFRLGQCLRRPEQIIHFTARLAIRRLLCPMSSRAAAAYASLKALMIASSRSLIAFCVPCGLLCFMVRRY